MTCTAGPAPAAQRAVPTRYEGPLHWRKLVQWLHEDAVISQDESQRTIARCSQAESVQHPLVRLASVSMRRVSDQKPLDIGRAALDYARKHYFDVLLVDTAGRLAIDEALMAEIRDLHATLTRLGVPHRYAEWPGAHTWAYWQAHAAESLQFLLGNVAGR